ncbi:MAG: 1-deoxy-D-xylulose-5-phosphate synthase [Bacillota bacterium]
MSKLLYEIDSPRDLKGLKEEELKQLVCEIREFLVATISSTGGHLASNLGVVELTVALHSHLVSPRDKIVWDVGHQSYTHKVLTGRRDQMSTIRQYGGLSGYPKYSESVHDIIETGHSSTSISSALGLALARDLQGSNERVYAVIGDGALTAGMALEALNHAGHVQTDLTVILNDNEMSIAPNVGALSHYLSSLRTDPTVNRVKEDFEFLLNRIPKIGPSMKKSVERLKNGLKYTMISGVLFEEMGFTYLGPLDGHNISELREHFVKADRVQGPVLVHINTRKGKGYEPAEDSPTSYHGVSPFIVENGESRKEKENPGYSQVFGETMVKIGRKLEEVVGITAAMPEGTGLNIFADEFPDRTYDVGIAEQHAVTLGAGLARGGRKPVVALYSSFLQRGYDQVIHDVCLQDLPVTFAIDRAGIVGSDGETHQGTFDLSFLRIVPNMRIMAPRDENELQHMLYTAVKSGGPAAVRYPRGEGYGVERDKELKQLTFGEGQLLREGEKAVFLGVGSCVYPALKAAEILQEKDNISVGVADSRFIKPLPEELLLGLSEDYDWIITVEEQVLAGGFGSAVLEYLNRENPAGARVKRVGLPDKFIPHGDMDRMRAEYGLDPESLAGVARSLLTEAGVN